MEPERRGRPVDGMEAKSKDLKIRIEPFLYEELVSVCRKIGVPISQGVRSGIVMFIRYVRQKT